MATAIGSWNAFISERDPCINIGIKDIEPANMNIKETSSGLRYQDRVVGSGKPVCPGQDVSIDYVGSDYKGNIFDRTYNNPYTFTLGKGEVIQGLDEGIEGMRVGGRRMLIIPADLAYGENPVVFDVQLMNASVNPGSNAKSLNRSSNRKQRSHHYTFDVDDNGLDINGFIIHKKKKGHKRHKFRVFLDTNENGCFDRNDELIGKTSLTRKLTKQGIGNLLDDGELGGLQIKFQKDKSNALMRSVGQDDSEWNSRISSVQSLSFTDSDGDHTAIISEPYLV